jgi:hypothetical protein
MPVVSMVRWFDKLTNHFDWRLVSLSNHRQAQMTVYKVNAVALVGARHALPLHHLRRQGSGGILDS